jgi:hypothetical protein
MDDQAEVGTFAMDVGEYIWLKSIRVVLAQDIPVTRDDAERAFAFVVGWVLRWEAFSHRYTKDRLGEWRRSLRPQTTDEPSVRPRIGYVEATGPTRRSADDTRTTALSLTLVDLPAFDWQTWIQILRHTLTELWAESSLQRKDGSSPPWANDDGVLTAEGIGGKDDAERLVEFVEEAVAATHESWKKAGAAAAKEALDAAGIESEFSEALADIEFDGAILVERTKCHSATRTSVSIKLRFGGGADLEHRFWRALHSSGQVGPGGGFQMDFHRDVLVASGDMSAAEVRDVLVEAVKVVEGEMREFRESEAKDEEMRREVEEAARKRAAFDG